VRGAGTLNLLVGPVGAGKTTLARRRIAASGGLLLDVDHWMVRLFGDDPRPAEGVLDWYLERRERCRALIWDLAGEALDAGTDVWLELGLLTATERVEAYRSARAEDRSLVVHLVDAPRDVRRERVLARNESGAAHTQVVPPAFFERASDAWEPPSNEERATYGLVDAT